MTNEQLEALNALKEAADGKKAELMDAEALEAQWEGRPRDVDGTTFVVDLEKLPEALVDDLMAACVTARSEAYNRAESLYEDALEAYSKTVTVNVHIGDETTEFTALPGQDATGMLPIIGGDYLGDGSTFAGWVDGEGASLDAELADLGSSDLDVYASFTTPEPEPEPEPGTDPEPGTGTDPEPGTGTDPEPGTGTDPEPGTGTDPEPGTGTDPEPGTGTDPEPGTGTDPEPGDEGGEEGGGDDQGGEPQE